MILTDQVERNERQWNQGLDAYPSTFGETMGANFDESIARNPTPSLMREMDRQGYYPSTDEFGIEGPARKDATILDAKRANDEYGIPGELSFGRDIPEPVAEELHRLKRDELQRRDVLNRSTGGFFRTVAGFGVSLGASVLDPINIASAFIPVVGPARYGVWASKYGPTAARLAKGGLEGAVGAAVVEPLVYGVAQQEQADYHAADSLMNLAFGTAIGGGLHAGLGKIGDMIAARHAQEPALRAAVAALSEERPVDVDALLRMDPEISRMLRVGERDLRGGTALSTTISDGPVAGVSIRDARYETPVEEVTLRDPQAVFSSLQESRARLAELEVELRRNPNPAIRKEVLAKIEAEQANVVGLRNDLHTIAETGESDTAASAAPRRPNLAGPERKPVSLTQALAGDGGIRDAGGELKAMDAGKQVVGLISRKGRALDDAAMWAWENGYFPGHKERPSINELLDAIRSDLTPGGKRYTVDDAALVADRRDAEANIEALHEAAQEMGIPVRKNMSDVEIMAQMRDHDLYYEALERFAIRAENAPEVRAEAIRDERSNSTAGAAGSRLSATERADRSSTGEQPGDAERTAGGTAEDASYDPSVDALDQSVATEALRQAAARANKPNALSLSDALAAADVERIAARAAETGDNPTQSAIKTIDEELVDLQARLGDAPDLKSADDAVKAADVKAKAYEQAAVCDYMRTAAE